MQKLITAIQEKYHPRDLTFTRGVVCGIEDSLSRGTGFRQQREIRVINFKNPVHPGKAKHNAIGTWQRAAAQAGA